MSTHDALTRRGGDRAWRTCLRRARRSLGPARSGWFRPVQPRPPRPRPRQQTAGPRPLLSGPSGRQLSRKLSPIERKLNREAPDLAGLFGVFTQLAEDEPAGGIEQLPDQSFPRPRPVHIAVLLALASVVALCLTLSFQVSPAPRSCSVASAPAAAVPDSVGVVTTSACGAYPGDK